MKAVVLKETGKLTVEDVPKPRLGPDDVMLRVTDCGICGSDIRYLHGENPWAQHTLGEARTNPKNIIPGHEVAGIVEEVGERADQSLLGKRVAVLSFKVDETCYWCRRGERHLCPNTQHLGHGAGWGDQNYYYGGMAEYVPIWSTHVFPLPDHVSSADSTLLDPLGVVVHAIELAELIPGESVLFMGAGVIGLLGIQTAQSYGATRIMCADLDESHLNKGMELGADLAINVKSQDLKKTIFDATDGIGARVIIDTAGRPPEELLPVLARGGRLINLAVHDRDDRLNQFMMAGERLMMTAANFRYEEYPMAMELLYTGRVKAEPLITHKFPISQAIEAFKVAENKEESQAIKVIINP
jgi:L-iditol 2-dehydrogenase